MELRICQDCRWRGPLDRRLACCRARHSDDDAATLQRTMDAELWFATNSHRMHDSGTQRYGTALESCPGHEFPEGADWVIARVEKGSGIEGAGVVEQIGLTMQQASLVLEKIRENSRGPYDRVMFGLTQAIAGNRYRGTPKEGAPIRFNRTGAIIGATEEDQAAFARTGAELDALIDAILEEP